MERVVCFTNNRENINELKRSEKAKAIVRDKITNGCESPKEIHSSVSIRLLPTIDLEESYHDLYLPSLRK